MPILFEKTAIVDGREGERERDCFWARISLTATSAGTKPSATCIKLQGEKKHLKESNRKKGTRASVSAAGNQMRWTPQGEQYEIKNCKCVCWEVRERNQRNEQCFKMSLLSRERPKIVSCSCALEKGCVCS